MIVDQAPSRSHCQVKVTYVDLLAIRRGENPALKAAVGAVELAVRVVRYLWYSLLMKKKVRFFTIGPPRDARKLVANVGILWVGRIWKRLRAPSAFAAKPVGVAVKLGRPRCG